MTPRRAHAQDGFTLVELLVAAAAGIVIVFALSSILIVTLHQTQRSFTQVDATRQARTGMAMVENELHSACSGPSSTDPIQPGSTSTTLKFLSYTGDSDAATPVWHEINFTGTTLTDTTYGVVPDANSNAGWDRSGTGTTTTVLGNVTTRGSAPIFQYWAYKAYQSGSIYDWVIPDGTNPLPSTGVIPTAVSLPASSGLSSSDANSAVEVVINLSVGATSESLNRASLSGTTVPVTDSILLRLTTPPNYSTVSNDQGDFGPCA